MQSRWKIRNTCFFAFFCCHHIDIFFNWIRSLNFIFNPMKSNFKKDSHSNIRVRHWVNRTQFQTSPHTA